MGFPYHELVPPAILFSNPGITREEFVELLDKTHATTLHEFKYKDSWKKKSKLIATGHHEGLGGLAGLLGLPRTSDFLKFQSPTYDLNNLPIQSPFLLPLNEDDGFFPTFRYCLAIHEKNNLLDTKKVKELAWDKLKEGDIWEEVMMGYERGLVTKIYSEENFGNENKNEEEYCESGPRYKYEMEIKPINPIFKNIVFQSDEEVYHHYPLFDPKFKFDWNKERGSFSIMLDNGSFLWNKKNNRYYLDPESFNRMSDGFIGTGQFGYHDLVLTSQAIKQKAWKLLSYRGLKHMPQFLRDFPESKKVYEKAIWDSQTSHYAKSQNMTISEFLRFRHPNFL